MIAADRSNYNKVVDITKSKKGYVYDEKISIFTKNHVEKVQESHNEAPKTHRKN